MDHGPPSGSIGPLFLGFLFVFSTSDHGQWTDSADPHRPNAPELGCFGLLSSKKVPPKLEIHPERGRVSKDSGQAQRRARGDAAPLVDQLIHTLIGNVDTICQFPLRNPQRLEKLLQKHLAWVRRLSMGRYTYHFRLLMVVHNRYVRRPRFRPAKADSVLVINPNAELAPSTSRQLLQTVPRRDSEFTGLLHRVYLIELASRDTPKTLRTRSSRSLGATPVEDVLGCLGCEGPNHKYMIARLVCYSKPSNHQKVLERESEGRVVSYLPNGTAGGRNTRAWDLVHLFCCRGERSFAPTGADRMGEENSWGQTFDFGVLRADDWERMPSNEKIPRSKV